MSVFLFQGANEGLICIFNFFFFLIYFFKIEVPLLYLGPGQVRSGLDKSFTL